MTDKHEQPAEDAGGIVEDDDGILGVRSGAADAWGNTSSAEIPSLPDTPQVNKPSFLVSTPRLNRLILPDIKYNKNKDIAAVQSPTYYNVKAVAEAVGMSFRFNMQTYEVEIRTEASGDQNVTEKYLDVLDLMGIKNEARIRAHVCEIAQENKYHPMEDWILSKKWDGVDRIPALCATLKLPSHEDRAFVNVLITKWLIQGVEAVRGWRRPRLRAKDRVLVLAGPQQIRKTTWLTSLVPPQFSCKSITLSLGGYSSGERDSKTKALSNPIGELGELETTFSKSDSGHLKSFLSETTDTFRMPYARDNIKVVRCVSFCGSVNRLDVFVDDTGTERFWPFEVDWCDTEHGIDMQQLWAQLSALWEGGANTKLTDEENGTLYERAEKFTFRPSIIEMLETKWDEQSRKVIPPDQWTPMTAVKIAIEFLGERRPGSKELGEIRMWMATHVGASSTINGMRNSWLMPFKPHY